MGNSDSVDGRWNAECIWPDLQHGFRGLLKAPGFSLAVIVTLALGLGANTAIFSIINGVLLSPLPYPHAERMLFIHELLPQGATVNVSWPDFTDWRAQNRVFQYIAAVQPVRMKLEGAGNVRTIPAAWVSSSLFRQFGTEPVAGRTFDESDDLPGRPLSVVLSYSFWHNVFDSNPNVVGTTIELDDGPAVVLGVLPVNFAVPYSDIDIYLPIEITASTPRMANRANHPGISVVATLKSGVSLPEARANIDAIMADLGHEYPESNKGETAILTPVVDQLLGSFRTKILLLFGAVAFVLVLACANVAHLALVRSAKRRHEFAVRAVLGAGRTRIFFQVLTENLLLSLIGGAFGFLLGTLATRAFAQLYPKPVLGLDMVHLDSRVFAFLLIISVLSGLLFGAGPALEAQRTDLATFLKEGNRLGLPASKQRLRSILMVSQIAIALVVATEAGLLLRSLSAVMNTDPGFRADHLVTAQVTRSGKGITPQENVTFFHSAIDRIGRLPGVISASAVMCPPFGGTVWTSPYVPTGGPVPLDTQQPWTALNMIMPDYFETVTARLVEGRFFTIADNDTAPPVAIVNQTMARTLDLPGRTVGNYVFVRYSPHPRMEIVGVVSDIKQYSLDRKDMPEVFVPFAQVPINSMTFIARTSIAPAALSRSMIAAIQALDEDQPVEKIAVMTDTIESGLADRRFLAVLLTAFAGTALLLAALGVSGVTAYATERRTVEFGVRMAVGARPDQILWLVLTRSMALATIGVTVGLAAAWAMTRLLVGVLFGVKPHDPLTFAGAAALLVVVALLSSYFPAKRATEIEPAVALRDE